ncbi:MAG: DNA/RNA helicase domain-containing protein [Bacteroidota bacterium]
MRETWPLVYIIKDDILNEAYVGETTNVISRMYNHLTNRDRKKLKHLHLITCNVFNKSATLDIEANLIKYIAADGKYKLQNGNAGLAMHEFYQKKQYEDLFQKIWTELQQRKITQKNISEINNSDLFKFSPYKTLSTDQQIAIFEIVNILSKHTEGTLFVEGSAGTGKTILAIYLIKLLLSDIDEYVLDEFDSVDRDQVELFLSIKKKYPNPKIAFVVPMKSLRKTLQNVFNNIKGLSSKMIISPFSVTKMDYDILIVDEAHRLKRKVNLSSPGEYLLFDKNNEKLNLDKSCTQLDWVIKQSKYQILFYDEMQSIKPTDVRATDFNNLFNKPEVKQVKLKSQFRVKGGADYMTYIDDLLSCRLTDRTKLYESSEYELILYEKIGDLVSSIDKKNTENGLSRLVAGYAWEWKSRNNDVCDIEIEDLKFKWNITDTDWINSVSSGAVSAEVGCIHTTQGYDLNYTGVIFGNEISYDIEKNEIVINQKSYFDTKGKNSIKDPAELKRYIINIYKTLLMRGINGTFIYVCDKNLLDYFKKHIKAF